MKKNTNLCVNLKTVMQEDGILLLDHCYAGCITRTSEDDFRFEEAIHKGRPKRNPKLFDGKYCSLVHMQNGKYQIHMRTIDASRCINPQDLAFKVYSELLNALNIID